MKDAHLVDIPLTNEVCEFTKINRTIFLTSIEIRIEEQFGKIIKKFPILHHGWDGDGYGYIVASIENAETKTFSGPLVRPKLVLTNHSNPYETSVSELKQKVIEYQQAIGETNNVIELLENAIYE
jgi:hypothetical protein